MADLIKISEQDKVFSAQKLTDGSCIVAEITEEGRVGVIYALFSKEKLSVKYLDKPSEDLEEIKKAETLAVFSYESFGRSVKLTDIVTKLKNIFI